MGAPQSPKCLGLRWVSDWPSLLPTSFSPGFTTNVSTTCDMWGYVYNTHRHIDQNVILSQGGPPGVSAFHFQQGGLELCEMELCEIPNRPLF